MSIPNDTNEPSPASAGSHGSAARWNGVPVAWAAVGKNGVPMWLAYHRQDAEGAVVGMADVVPLYRSPTLTDEEHLALCKARDAYAANSEDDDECAEVARAIRGLLERLG